jgi:MFS family permease
VTTATVDVVPSYRDPNVLRWLTGFGIGLAGDQIYFLALSWAAVQVATPSQVGLVLAAGSVPRAALLLFGGAIADRIGPKPVVLVSDGTRAVVMAALAALLVFGQASVLLLVTLAVVFGVVDALFLPAVGSLPPRLVPTEELTRLQALRSFVQRTSIVVGAPVGGWLIAQFGLAVAFGTTAVLFGGSVLALAFTHLRTPATMTPELDTVTSTGGILSDVGSGLRYVRCHPILPALLVLMAVGELGFTGPIDAGLPLLAAKQGWGAGGVGLVLTGFGAGAAASALGIAALGNIPRAGLLSCVAVVLLGIAVAGIGVAPSMWWAVGAAVVLGLASGVCGSLVSTLLLTVTEPSQVGRVLALSSLASLGGIPLAYTATGVLAGLTSPGMTFILGGTVSALTGVAALVVGPMRHAEVSS